MRSLLITSEQVVGGNDGIFDGTGVGYTHDKRMELHCNTSATKGPLPHPECPERHAAIVDQMRISGFADRCSFVPARAATEAELEQLHTAEYIQRIKASAKADQKKCEQLAGRYQHDVFINPATWEAALIAAGSALQITSMVVAGSLKHAMAVIRPPGHHACQHKVSAVQALPPAAACGPQPACGLKR
jgi:acetoin utilization deacetylase AcuC-like enzyme